MSEWTPSEDTQISQAFCRAIKYYYVASRTAGLLAKPPLRGCRSLCASKKAAKNSPGEAPTISSTLLSLSIAFFKKLQGTYLSGRNALRPYKRTDGGL
jgi:hypothetical protein